MKRILLSLALISLASTKVHAVGNVDVNATKITFDYLKKSGAAESEKLHKVDVRIKQLPMSLLNNRKIVEMTATALTAYKKTVAQGKKTGAPVNSAEVVAKAVLITYLRELSVDALALFAQKAGLDLGKYVKCPTLKAGIESFVSHNVRGTLDEVLSAGVERRAPAFKVGFSYEL